MEIEDVESEKYIGDIISNNGKNLITIKSRPAKAKGMINSIMKMLYDDILGDYFEMAVLFRNSLLLSSLLCNPETWINVTNVEMKMLERAEKFSMHIVKPPWKCYI